MSETFTLPTPRRNAKFYPPMHQRIERPSDAEVIIGQVCRQYGLSLAELRGKDRDRVSLARHDIARRLNMELGMPPLAIAPLMGRDALTVASWLPREPDPVPETIVVAVEEALAMGGAAVIGAMRRIAEEVAAKHDLYAWEEMRSRRRGRKLCQARWEAWYRCVHETPHSYPTIGRFFGFDHSSVIYGVKRHGEMMGTTVST